MNYKNIFNTKTEVELVEEATRISTEIHKNLVAAITKEHSPFSVNELARELTAEYNVAPAFLGVEGPIDPFPGNLCVSVNDETLHTIPFSKEKFKDGDLVKVDFGIIFEGIYTDHCRTVGVGDLDKDEKTLIELGRLCIDNAIDQMQVGKKIGDVSNALQTTAQKGGANYVTSYAGHAIGEELWLEPQIPAYGKPGTGEILQEGMLFCVENQITYGDARLEMDDDGWTLRTRDGSKSVMFEDMVLVTQDGPLVLTK